MMHAHSTGPAIAARSIDSLRRLAVLALVAGALVAADQPDQVGTALEDLRAANVARAAQAREWQQWQVESERGYALLDGVQAQVARLRAEAAAARDTAAKLRQETDAAGETRRQLARLDERFAAAAQAIVAALATARGASAPGAVPVPADGGDARARFAAAMRALEAAEHAGAATAVEIVEGDLGGEVRAVTMLRVAGLSWWSEIDGARAGIVVPQPAGRPRLDETHDAAEAEAIRRAVAVAQGARPPELLLLPVPKAAIADVGAAK